MSNSLGLTVSSPCTDLVRYVPAEEALGLKQPEKSPAQTGTLARINPSLVNHALSYLPVEDLPSYAWTSTGNQSQVVSHCFRRMKEAEYGGHFASLAVTVTLSRGPNHPFQPADVFQIDGACKLKYHMNDVSYLLGDDEHNRRLAEKLPNLRELMIAGPTPDLSPFATHCPKLDFLWLNNGTLTGEEPLQSDFPSLEKLTMMKCPQLTDAGIDNILSHSPKIVTCGIIPQISPETMNQWTPKIHAINAASNNKTLNAMYHGPKEPKPESKKSG